MKFCKLMKDGGEESKVWGYFLIEWKIAFSIVLLNFKDGSREAYHEHAFNAISWVLRGKLVEHLRGHDMFDKNIYTPSLIPIITRRDTFHKVSSIGSTWVLSFRGSWIDKWREFIEATGEFLTLTHGRKIVPTGN